MLVNGGGGGGGIRHVTALSEQGGSPSHHTASVLPSHQRMPVVLSLKVLEVDIRGPRGDKVWGGRAMLDLEGKHSQPQ